MTFIDLQNDLVEELENVLKDVATKDKSGSVKSGIHGYAHRLPILEEDEDDVDSYFPYFIVRVNSVETENDDDWWHASMDIVIGIYDRSTYLGHETVLIAMQRILDRFVSDPKLKKRYRAEQDLTAVMQEDDTYPHYFGAVSITFAVPKIGRKADYYV